MKIKIFPFILKAERELQVGKINTAQEYYEVAKYGMKNPSLIRKVFFKYFNFRK